MKEKSSSDISVKLRILYLVPELFGPPGGIARYCRTICRALTALSCQVTVVALLDEDSAAEEASITFPAMYYRPCAGKRNLFLQRSVMQLRRRPDFILVGHPNLAPLGQVLAKVSGAKMISFIYGIDAWEPLSQPRRRALSAADCIVSISKFTAARAGTVNGLPMSKIRFLPPCRDTPMPDADPVIRGSSSLSLLTVARMSLSEQYKGHDTVIRAMPKLLQEFPDLKYNVIGGGDGRPVLETLAMEQGVGHSVIFRGIIGDDELMRYYHESTIFVMPSRFEGFGIVFLDAMACGKPVVAGNEDASVEVVRNGITGFTVAPQNIEAVAEAIAVLLRDKDLRDRMGRKGAEVVADEFGFDRFRHTLHQHLQAIQL
jgi:glycosyltransferase involved in cell wall biosynthesis